MSQTRDLLTLTQWLSPGFPIGSFAYSHGLETAIAKEDVRDTQSLKIWLSDILQFGSGAVDATLLCLTIRGEDVADEAIALAASKERLEETLSQGQAFAKLTDVNAPRPIALPIAVGHAARSLDLPPTDIAALYLQTMMSNLVTIAVRAIPLGQSAGQAVLADLAPLISQIASNAVSCDLDDIGSAAFRGDIASMVHETQEIRLFKT
ncbi:UNVERIFIED_CONTAM: hypothetical protein GTU68_055433 [Idotea baltica]|nr:hypothetical protein [Idotea baltica]